MTQNNTRNDRKIFKKPPRRYQPKGLSIIYEDCDIIVVDKTNGLLTIGTDKVKNNSAFFYLNDYVRKGNSKSKNRVYVVHRLDKDTSGVLVFAKSEKIKHFLQESWGEFSKKYYALVYGIPREEEGMITSYLTENNAYKMYSVNDPKKGSLAKTGYKVIKKSKHFSLLEVDLLTGKKNQIRVHFAEKGNPIVGDKKYDTKEKDIRRLGLHATSLTLIHPYTKKEMTFTSKIPSYFEQLMNRK